MNYYILVECLNPNKKKWLWSLTPTKMLTPDMPYIFFVGNCPNIPYAVNEYISQKEYDQLWKFQNKPSEMLPQNKIIHNKKILSKIR